MKKTIFMVAIILLLSVVYTPCAKAYEISAFDDSIEELKNSLSDDARERMKSFGIDGPEDMEGLCITEVFKQLTDDFSDALHGPLSTAAILLAALLIISLLEGYTESLRHTQMKEIMAAVSSLFMITSVVTPLCKLLQNAVLVIEGASAMMLLYIPLMIGVLAFSGHFVQAGGYYATVMSASYLVSWASSTVLSPLLNSYLAISCCSGISGRVRLKGFCEMACRFVRWTLTFLMCVYTGILSLQTITANAADSVAVRATRFTLSSLIPVVGSAVSEAYKTLQSSVHLLRSGIGVFVLLAVTLSFAPVLIRTAVWSMTLRLCCHTAGVLNDDSAAAALESLSSALSLFMAIMISVLLVFLISTGSLLMIGGSL